MLFNADKCKFLHIGYDNCHVCGNKLKTVDEEKDLGVGLIYC